MMTSTVVMRDQFDHVGWNLLLSDWMINWLWGARRFQVFDTKLSDQLFVKHDLGPKNRNVNNGSELTTPNIANWYNCLLVTFWRADIGDELLAHKMRLQN